MLSPLALLLVLGPSAGIIGGIYFYSHSLRKRRGKNKRSVESRRKKTVRLVILNVLPSFLSASWIELVLVNANSLGLGKDDMAILGSAHLYLQSLSGFMGALNAITPGLADVVLLTAIVTVVLLPAPIP